MPTPGRTLAAVLSALALLAAPSAAEAFCGFYVAKADTQLFNQASQVVLARDGERTVVTMSNDFKGELTDFAVVIPVPTLLKREQIRVMDRTYLERLDAYSAPRLVEHPDEHPCGDADATVLAFGGSPADGPGVAQAQTLGVRVEAQYTVGEYDIVILSAKQSDGLETWLRESGYKIPERSAKALQPYIKQDMRFFVAKVNLKSQKAAGFTYLRPLQMEYESKKFMLPIRLGMANATGPQDLVIYALTRTGRVESTNYKTVKVPSDVEVPVFVKQVFGDFYKEVFNRAYERQSQRAVFTEYFWNVGWCDPCAAGPLSPEELRTLGVFWLSKSQLSQRNSWGRREPWPVVLTRLHVRYDSEHFPEDLIFQETGDRQNFQGRYIVRNAVEGVLTCEEGGKYVEQLKKRRAQQAKTLAELTGWAPNEISERMALEKLPSFNPKYYEPLLGK